MADFSGIVARRYLAGVWRRAFIGMLSILTIAGITLGVFAVQFAMAGFSGFFDSILEKIQNLNAHLTVFGPVEGISPEQQAQLELFLKNHGDVEAVAPLVYSTGLVQAQASESSKVIKLIGVTQEGFSGAMRWDQEKGFLGEVSDLELEDTVFLGEDLARSLGLNPGDPVDVILPRLNVGPFGAVPRLARFTYRGEVSTQARLIDEELGLVPMATLQRLMLMDDRVSAYQVRLHDFSQLEKVKTDLVESMPGGLFYVDLMEQNRDVFQLFELQRVGSILAISLIVAVASLNIVACLMIMVLSKIRDLGVLTTLGATRWGIARIFFYQGMTLAGIGTFLGTVLGVGGAWFCDANQLIKVENLGGDLWPFKYIPFRVHPGQASLVVVVTLVICALASFYPAWRAGSLASAEAIRYD